MLIDMILNVQIVMQNIPFHLKRDSFLNTVLSVALYEVEDEDEIDEYYGVDYSLLLQQYVLQRW